MKLVKIETNFYLDEATETYYEFSFSYPVTQQEAERLVDEHFRHYQDEIGLGDYYRRTHLIPQTGFVGQQ